MPNGSSSSALALTRTIRGLKWVLISAFVIPLAMFASLAWHGYARTTELAKQALLQTSRIVQEHAAKVFQSNELLLDRAVEARAPSPRHPSKAPSHRLAVLAQQQPAQRRVAGLLQVGIGGDDFARVALGEVQQFQIVGVEDAGTRNPIFNGDGHVDLLFCNTMNRRRGGVTPSFVYWGNPQGQYSVEKRLELDGVEPYTVLQPVAAMMPMFSGPCTKPLAASIMRIAVASPQPMQEPAPPT